MTLTVIELSYEEVALSKIAHELEFKVELGLEAMDTASNHPSLTGLAVQPPRTERLRAIYFDTTDRRLEAAGIRLRVRDEDGQWIQTVKVGGGVNLGLSKAREVSVPVPQPRPNVDEITDPDARDRVVRALGTSSLRPMFETVVLRSTHLVSLPARGDCASDGLVEVAMDQGQVHTPAGDVIIRDIEIELKDGHATALLEAADALLTDIPFRLATENKAERGFRRLDGLSRKQLKETLEPEKPSGELSGDTPAIAAFRTIGAAYCGAALAYKDQIPEDDDPEGPHQLRVNLRRLRTLLKAFRPVLDTDRLRRLSVDARELARIAGRLRDADVIVTEVVPDAASVPPGMDAEALAALRDHLRTTRDTVKKEVIAEIASADHSPLMVECALFPFVVETEADTADSSNNLQWTFAMAGRKALARSWRSVLSYGKDIDHLSIEERHELRKALKGLRYTIDIFSPAFPDGNAASYIRQLRKMQDVFGYLNDVATAEAQLEPYIADRQSAGSMGDAARAVISWHEKHADKAWLQAKKRWVALRDTPKFWTNEVAASTDPARSEA